MIVTIYLQKNTKSLRERKRKATNLTRKNNNNSKKEDISLKIMTKKKLTEK